jgi:hypothetical protein
MDFSARSPIFNTLLDFNPWASSHWQRRLELVDAGLWHVGYLNQGRNAETISWFQTFLKARSEATLARLETGSHGQWDATTRAVITPLFRDEGFAAAPIGALERSGGGYAPDQFKADVLMLAQCGLHEVHLEAPLDLSSQVFTIGPWIYVSSLGDVKARNTRFGPFTEFVSCTLGSFDAAGAVFLGPAGFTPSQFDGRACFAGAEFHGTVSFSAVNFTDAANFTGAKFLDWTSFSGSVFGGDVSFRDACFEDDAGFEAAAFNASVDFTEASIRGQAITVDIWNESVVAQIKQAQKRGFRGLRSGR